MQIVGAVMRGKARTRHVFIVWTLRELCESTRLHMRLLSSSDSSDCSDDRSLPRLHRHLPRARTSSGPRDHVPHPPYRQSPAVRVAAHARR